MEWNIEMFRKWGDEEKVYIVPCNANNNWCNSSVRLNNMLLNYSNERVCVNLQVNFNYTLMTY